MWIPFPSFRRHSSPSERSFPSQRMPSNQPAARDCFFLATALGPRAQLAVLQQAHAAGLPMLTRALQPCVALTRLVLGDAAPLHDGGWLHALRVPGVLAPLALGVLFPFAAGEYFCSGTGTTLDRETMLELGGGWWQDHYLLRNQQEWMFVWKGM